MLGISEITTHFFLFLENILKALVTDFQGVFSYWQLSLDLEKHQNLIWYRKISTRRRFQQTLEGGLW